MKTFHVDSKAELTSIIGAEMGDIAYVVNEASKYMINSVGEWVNQTGIADQGLATEEYVDNAIEAINPVKDIYGDAHAFGLMVDSTDNKTLIQAMLEKGKAGMYNFHVENGSPGQPEEVVAKNSSCRGIACVDTYRSDSNWYGWILMFDQDGDVYTQYIRDAEPKGWKKVAFV